MGLGRLVSSVSGENSWANIALSRIIVKEAAVLFKKDETTVVAGGKIESILGANTSFNGTIKSDGNLRIDGVFQGHIETAGNVIVGPSAKVMADIVANSVQVWGAVRGDISAQNRLEILSSGRVWGDIRSGSLLIDEGGVFRGECQMADEQGVTLSLLEAPDGGVITAETRLVTESENGQDKG